jgi:signal transduction histidine kinase
MAQAVGTDAVVLTEAVLAPIAHPQQQRFELFTVLISEQFSALLVGMPNEYDTGNGRGSEVGKNTASPPPLLPVSLKSDTSSLCATLTFAPDAIASFLENLLPHFAYDSQIQQHLVEYCQIIRPNDAKLQEQFTLLLFDLLGTNHHPETLTNDSPYPFVSVCQQVEDALKRQVAQEKLLNQVTTQIRQSQDLPVIFATAVEQVREFLELDRLVIFKFEDLLHQNQTSEISAQPSDLPDGLVVYEARSSDTIPPVLNYKKNCFTPSSISRKKYRQGFTLAVDDVEKTYALQQGKLQLLRDITVRAKLVAPIVFEEQLWGLLIAQQCSAPREWKESETSLLAQIAEQLAIAIHQAELMQSLNKEKQTLEQRLMDCTIALQDALVAAQAASRVRSEFLATISHELLTPLTYVIGMSSTLLHWHLGELQPRQREYLQRIHDSGEHLLGLINDILDLSQIEAGKVALKVQEFSLVNLAENTVRSVTEKAIEQQVNIHVDLQLPPQGDRFTADEARVQQILWNLLSNAVKFTPENGNVTFRLWLEDDNAVFQVEDTGIGIPEEQLPLLFEKFQQLDTPYRRRYEGTGLGLALTKQLVELHRGRIEVESTVGAGSIFTVWIPAQPILIRNS